MHWQARQFTELEGCHQSSRAPCQPRLQSVGAQFLQFTVKYTETEWGSMSYAHST